MSEAASALQVPAVSQWSGSTPSPVGASGVHTSGSRMAPLTRHVWLLTGPAGCGKSSIAESIAAYLQLPFIEGDKFHPESNIFKMSNGVPLTDADRWDWLIALRDESLRQLNNGHHGVILTCSALKRKYRDVIRVTPYFAPNVQLHFLYLNGSEEILMQRVASRKDHYMSAEMVHSQFSILEPPGPDELDMISIDVTRTFEDVLEDVLVQVRSRM